MNGGALAAADLRPLRRIQPRNAALVPLVGTSQATELAGACCNGAWELVIWLNRPAAAVTWRVRWSKSSGATIEVRLLLLLLKGH